MSEEREVLTGWRREFLRTGRVPAALTEVQSRLIRSVHRGVLPGGDVFVKTMTFPRRKDRLRYLLRPLPAEHEAAALRHAAAAGLPCPQVVEACSARRLGLPHRSWLVLRALPVVDESVAESAAAAQRLADEAALALRLLEAGIDHRDLHRENFVRLEGGALAVLDMQSTRLHRRAVTDRAHRVAAAARLIRDLEADVAAPLRASGLLVDAAEIEAAQRSAARQREAYLRGRVMRCFAESTEFTRRLHFCGVEYRARGELPAGRWCWRGRELRTAWLGQRARSLFGSRSPLFPAFFQKWWWLGGAAALYVPQACSEDRIDAELKAASAGFALLAECTQSRGATQDGES